MRVAIKYRLLRRATWGIAINLVAEFIPMTPSIPGACRITSDLWLAIDPSLRPNRSETFFIKLGLRMVADAIGRNKRFSGAVVVRLIQIEYNPTNYQAEGLAYAVASLAAEAFGFDKPEELVEFDKARGRYVFSFEPWQI